MIGSAQVGLFAHDGAVRHLLHLEDPKSDLQRPLLEDRPRRKTAEGALAIVQSMRDLTPWNRQLTLPQVWRWQVLAVEVARARAAGSNSAAGG